MEYAVFITGGKQYRVSIGDILNVDKIQGEENKPFLFEDVLLYVSDAGVKLGKPILPGFKIKAKILKQKKGEKLYVLKFKAKARYRKKTGFRPLLTEILIEGWESRSKKS